VIKIKTLFIISFVLASFPLILNAQSNTVIDNLLEKDKAGFGSASYMVFTAAGILKDNSSFEEALQYLNKLKWKMNNKEPGEYITLGEYSYMLMKTFNIDGGIMYQIFPGPKYAARELFYLKLIDKDRDSSRYISGEEVIRILGRLLEWKENKQ